MGSYEATLIAGQTLEFTIPAPCYRFQVTSIGTSASAAAYITGDGTQPVVPVAETVNTGTQVCLAGNTGEQVSVRGSLPGSGSPVVNGSGGTDFPQVLILSSGTPTLLVEW